MKISNQQAIFMFQILRDSLHFNEKKNVHFIASHSLRMEFFQKIYMQQNDLPVELEIPMNYSYDECQHESDRQAFNKENGIESGLTKGFKCKKCKEFYKEECQHESDCIGYTTGGANGEWFEKCKKCGEFYR